MQDNAKEQEYREEAERLAHLPVADQREIIALHRTIASISGNPIFEAVARAMLEWLERFHEGLVRAPGREPVGFAEHTRIVNCIAKHDAEGAARAMTAHLTRANKLYIPFERRDAAEH